MSKYSNEFKLEVVKYYIENNENLDTVAKHFGLTNQSSVQRWARLYKEEGISGIISSPAGYSGDFKIYVVEYMHENKLTPMEACLKFNIKSPLTVFNWERIYYERGALALYDEECDKKRENMKPNQDEKKEKKISKDSEEKLIAENERLRMENEYLKKLNALVQERVQQKITRK